MKTNKFLILLLLANFSFAQYTTSAKVKPVSVSGLYKITLPAEIRNNSKEDLSDLRLFDSEGAELSYAVPHINFDATHYKYTALPMLSKTTVANKSTTIIVQNTKKEIWSLSMNIANTEISKKYSISGSDDQKNWYGLANNKVFSGINGSEGLSGYEEIQLPGTNYKYFKLIFDDTKSLAVNVISVGSSDMVRLDYPYVNVKPRKIKITNDIKEKKTVIRVDFDNPTTIDRLSFTISEPRFYNRTAAIYTISEQTIKHHKQLVREYDIAGEIPLELNNLTGKNTFDRHLYQKTFYIEIINNDSPPLKIGTLTFSQVQFSLVADLKANKNYTLKTGNNKVTAPIYDLFNGLGNSYDTLRQLPEAKIVSISHLHKNETCQALADQQKAFWQQPWFMWMCITVGGITILFFVVSLVKDIK